MAIQSVCLLLPGRAKVAHARFYWAVGLPAARASGTGDRDPPPTTDAASRRIRLQSFVVARCPRAGRPPECLFRIEGRGGRLAVRRHRRAIRSHRLHLSPAPCDRRGSATPCASGWPPGDNLMLFPEGTTSDGSRVLPFRSSFFAIAEGADPPLSPARLGGLRPAGRPADRPGEPPGLRLVRRHGPRHTFLALCPASRAAGHDPAASRRSTRRASPAARRCHMRSGEAVADGAASLRQNRPVEAVDVAADAAGGASLCVRFSVDTTVAISWQIAAQDRRRTRAAALDRTDAS